VSGDGRFCGPAGAAAGVIPTFWLVRAGCSHGDDGFGDAGWRCRRGRRAGRHWGDRSPNAGPPEDAVSEGGMPWHTGGLEVSLLRSGCARPSERRSLRSAKEALPYVELVHDKTWRGGASPGWPPAMDVTAAR
jgi:hypothetical protein